MKLHITDMDDLKLPSVLYNLEIYKVNLSTRDLYSIENTFRRYRKQFPHVSYLIVFSDVESNNCRKIEMKTGKRGRPKTIVLGYPKAPHIHIAVIGDENNSASEYMKKIKKAVNKRLGGGMCEIVSKGVNAGGFINYCLKQAKSIKIGGKFNFKKYKNPFDFN